MKASIAAFFIVLVSFGCKQTETKPNKSTPRFLSVEKG